MKNEKVVMSFINGSDAVGSNLRSEKGILYSYQSILALWLDGKIVVDMNIATYSQTSKRHWFYLRTQAPGNLLTLVNGI